MMNPYDPRYSRKKNTANLWNTEQTIRDIKRYCCSLKNSEEQSIRCTILHLIGQGNNVFWPTSLPIQT